MISVVSGIPGGGKGIYLMRSIVRQLVRTNRYIVTNLPVDLGRLNEHLQQRYPDLWSSDIHNRIRLLKDEEVFCFYRIRRGGLVLDADSDWRIRIGELGKEEKKDRPDFVAEMKEIFSVLNTVPEDQRGGVDYFIDEAHNYFDAREWASIGRALSYYCSQHRHLDDNVFFASQNPEQMEGRLRLLAQERAECRNMYSERFGWFRKRGRFRVSFYYRCPKSLAGAQPFQRLHYQLDVAEASCYQTTGAMGVGSGEAETKRKVGGLPWWGIPVAGAAVVALFVGGIVMLPNLIAGGMGYLTGETARKTSEVLRSDVEEPEKIEVGQGGVSGGEDAGRVEVDSGPKFFRSLSVFGDWVRVTLPDGEVVTSADPRLEVVTVDYVQIAGARYYPASTGNDNGKDNGYDSGYGGGGN